jgi:dTDP-4-dehydrorhamnose 3,5-epimerase
MPPALATIESLRRIPTGGGDVLHAIKASDPGFVGFGEAYFTWVMPGAVKAWKLHQRMTLNLVVPVGTVRFAFHHDTHPGQFQVEDIGEERYARITAGPGVWFGFQGLAGEPSLVMNLADLEHDPNEVLRRPVDDIPFEWRRPH